MITKTANTFAEYGASAGKAALRTAGQYGDDVLRYNQTLLNLLRGKKAANKIDVVVDPTGHAVEQYLEQQQEKQLKKQQKALHDA